MLHSLAYVGVWSSDVEEWRTFATDVLGCMVTDPGPDGALRLRVDDHAWRIQVHEGEQGGAAYFGWAVMAEEDLDVFADRLAKAGIAVEWGTPELAADRCVHKLLWFVDPWGFRHELVFGQMVYPATFHPGRAMSGFVTGDQGLGHLALKLPDVDAAERFFTDVLGFKLSDKMLGNGHNARFLHCNGRHHTLAFGQSSGEAALFHLMLEVKTADDMGTALDVATRRGIVARSIGRHTNDRSISCYFRSPSGFDIEYGFGGLEVDDDWLPATYSTSSIWGHHFQTVK